MPTTDYYKAFCDKGGKDFDQNLRQRVRILEQAENDPLFQKHLMESCKEDILFFFNAFCWLYEPRPRKNKEGKKLPPIMGPVRPATLSSPLQSSLTRLSGSPRREQPYSRSATGCIK